MVASTIERERETYTKNEKTMYLCEPDLKAGPRDVGRRKEAEKSLQHYLIGK